MAITYDQRDVLSSFDLRQTAISWIPFPDDRARPSTRHDSPSIRGQLLTEGLARKSLAPFSFHDEGHAAGSNASTDQQHRK